MLKYWQEQLKLQDWDVVVRMDNYLRDKHGEVNWVFPKKQALIGLENPDYVNPKLFKSFPMSSERTVIHELLHLHFVFIDTLVDSDTKELIQPFLEQAIHNISGALYKLKTEKEK